MNWSTKLNTIVISLVYLLIIPTTSFSAQEKIKQVAVQDVPGLLTYIKTNFEGAKIDRKFIDIDLVDLNEVPDGIDEVILGVKDIQRCGSDGCHYDVLKRAPSGEFISLASALTHNIVATSGYSNGLRNLVFLSRHGLTLHQFDGKKYQPVRDNLAELAVTQNTNTTNSLPEYYKGRCYNGDTWSGGQRNVTAGGIASYSVCGDSKSTFYFECKPGTSQVKLYVGVKLDGIRDGENLKVQIKVGKRRFILTGNASYSEVIGGTQPILEFDKNNRLFVALKKGKSGKILIGRKGLKFHLKDSSNSIDAMLAGCLPVSANPQAKIVKQQIVEAKSSNEKTPPDLLMQLEITFEEIKRIATLYKKKKYKQIRKPDLAILDKRLNDIFDGKDLNNIPLGTFTGRLDLFDRYRIVNAYRRHFKDKMVKKFDTKINLIDTLSVNLEDHFAFISAIYYEAINLKYRDFPAYERMIELLGKHGGVCGSGYSNPERQSAGLCISQITRRNFAATGDFYMALEWAHESVRYLEKSKKTDPNITGSIKLDLAELEFSHGSQKAAKRLIVSMSDEELLFLRSDQYSKNNLGKLLAKISQINSIQSVNLTPERSKIEEYYLELIETDKKILEFGFTDIAFPNIERAAILLRLFQKSQLPTEIAKGLKKKLLKPGKYPWPLDPKLSTNANLDFILLMHGPGLFLSRHNRQFKSFLFDRNTNSKRLNAREIFGNIFVSSYQQFSGEVSYYDDMNELANAMDIIGYPSAARETRLQVFETLKKNFPSPEDQNALKVTLAPQFLNMHSRLAQELISSQKFVIAIKHLEAMVPIATQRFANQWKAGTQDIGDSVIQLAPHLERATALWGELSAKHQKVDQTRIARGAFRSMQLLQLGEVALAMQAGARATLVGNEKTATALKEYERINNRSLHLAGIRNIYKTEVPDGIENALIASRKAGSLAEKKVRSILPFIEAFTDVAPVSIKKIQKHLTNGEALVTIVPAQENTYILVIDKGEAKFSKIDVSSAKLAADIEELRKGLNPATTDLQTYGSFNAKLAHRLYKSIFGKVEPVLLRNNRIVLVAAGAVSSIPFSILITEEPSLVTSFKELAWLAKSHSISNSVSAAGFVAARANPTTIFTLHREPLIGFGDPVFDPAKRADKTEQDKKRQLASLSRGIEANVTLLTSAPPLPETKDELYTVARTLGAPIDNILLGTSASENALKLLSENGSLKQFKIVYFATHGLVAGELNGSNEPGLVLSVPKVRTVMDDGFLSSSEISQLKLNADWVVLSACNTAAPGKPGADALSGLAKSFFKAGSRSVLASHWPVISAAAVKLTTGTFKKLVALPNLSRAEALRLTMMDILLSAKNKIEQHPAYWAPFVLVGNGNG